MKAQIQLLILAYLASIGRPTTADDARTLAQMGLDSLDVFELNIALEDEISKTISGVVLPTPELTYNMTIQQYAEKVVELSLQTV